MRGSLIGLAVALLGVACFDFGLEHRRFRCDGEGASCSAGQICGSDGFCAPDSDGAAGEICDNGMDDDGDDLIDCLDPDCGPDPCEDDNPCTIDTCNLDGSCTNAPVTAGSSCGNGCVCSAGGVPREVLCNDRLDNDGDGDIDCNDSDCPECSGELTCCPDGECALTCK